MANISIGINALRMAAQLIDMAGDNIANANTPGYHAKRASVLPLLGASTRYGRVGLGATVEDVVRIRNILVEGTLLTHIQLKERLGQELEALGHLELLFGEPSEAGLDALMGQFFDSIAQLAADPDDLTLREAVVQKAFAVCDAFQGLDEGFDAVTDSMLSLADFTVARINGLTERIASLNGQIRLIETGGISAPGLKDTRDELISQLAELINVTVFEEEYGVSNVSCAGTLLVSGNQSTAIQRTAAGERIIIAAVGGVGHQVSVREGRLAGILETANDVLPQCRATLDELANTLRRSVNLVHTTALGLGGRFHSLDGLNAFLSDDPVSELGYGVPAGTNEKLFINVEDEATGQVTQYELTLDTTQAADAFLADLRDAINAGVDHVTATVEEGRLKLAAEDRYAFGFATPYDPNPAEPGDITGATPTSPTILDAYTGQTDLSYEFAFLGGGEIGTDDITIEIQVREPGGPLLRTLTRQIGSDYDPGGAIALENGLKFTLSAGDVTAGDTFSVISRASMDTAGILDALGLNVLFNGLGASDVHIAERVYQDPSNLAGALRRLPGDNHRLLDMAALRDAKLAASGTVSLSEFYMTLLSGIATTRNTKSVAHRIQEELVKNLRNRRDSVSGVSVDEEMVRIVQSRTIYQGALKYLSIIDGLMSDLVSML